MFPTHNNCVIMTSNTRLFILVAMVFFVTFGKKKSESLWNLMNFQPSRLWRGCLYRSALEEPRRLSSADLLLQLRPGSGRLPGVEGVREALGRKHLPDPVLVQEHVQAVMIGEENVMRNVSNKCLKLL